MIWILELCFSVFRCLLFRSLLINPKITYFFNKLVARIRLKNLLVIFYYQIGQTIFEAFVQGAFRNVMVTLLNLVCYSRSHFQFTKHSPYLVSISKSKIETVVNTTGVVHSMINNLYGTIKFRNGTSTEVALFSAKSLYCDGYVYDRDPMHLPAIQFDG